MNDISNRVKKVVAEQLNVKLEKVLDTSRFVEDLKADSLDSVELVMALEEEFDHKIDDELAENIDSVDKAVEYLTNNLG
jgi:acyl carrier protein